MADYESIEQEQKVKEWLRENGIAIVMGLVLAFGGLFGFKQWQVWEQGKNEKAFAEYSVLVDLLEVENLDGAVGSYETLKAEASDSPYTSMAALRMARARVQAGQTELAVAPLEFAMANGTPSGIQTIARGRLARVQLDLGDPEAALATLDGATDLTGFEALFAETRGDAYVAMGDANAARGAYVAALDSLESGTGNRPYLEIKIQGLGAPAGEDADGAAEADS